LVYTINGCFFKKHKSEFSVFGEVVDQLMKTRKKYKKQMFDAVVAKDKDMEMFYHTRQLVYKVLANTLYGVVANKAFRFYDNSLAAAITLSGQEALKTSIIQADSFMRHLNLEKEIIPPKTLTKKEMFALPEKDENYYLPERSHEYIVTGDTDSIFCCFQNFNKKHKLNIEQIHKWCSEIENFLNKEKIIELVKLHQVDLDFNRLALKNELVISRGLFLAKKRYAIKVVNQEGKNVEKINYMGLEIKRSDYPSKSKEFLTNIIDLVFNNADISLTKILDYIKKQEKIFYNLISIGDKSIARPISYTKDIEDYKVIPQNIKAFENWNKIMYDIHKPGTKGYMFMVSGIDEMKAPPDVMKRYSQFLKDGNKLEVIAVPDDEHSLPNYFIPNVKQSMRFAFTDRYELMLKPLLDTKTALKNKVITF